MTIADKTERNERLDEIEAGVTATLVGSDDEPGAFAGRAGEIKTAFRSLQKQVVRKRIVDEGVRIDGRGTGRHPAAVRRGRRSSRPRTAPASSSAARPRC